MTHLTSRVESIEDSQATVLSALEALQQSVARINFNAMTQPSSNTHSSLRRATSTDTERYESRTLRQERSMHMILSLPSNWEASADASQQQDDALRDRMQSGFARSGVRLRVSRVMPRSQTGLTPKEFVPEKPKSSRTRSSVQPAARRAFMFSRRSPVVASRPSLTKKRELLADSLWTQYRRPSEERMQPRMNMAALQLLLSQIAVTKWQAGTKAERCLIQTEWKVIQDIRNRFLPNNASFENHISCMRILRLFNAHNICT